MQARIFLFALEELRSRFGELAWREGDPRHDTGPFRAFRAALLDKACRAALSPAELSFWWEGTYNGYWLAVAVTPPEALPAGFDPERVCPVEEERVAQGREERYSLAHLRPGAWEVARDAEGAAFEAPFGAPAGHFGAPGVRAVRAG